MGVELSFIRSQLVSYKSKKNRVIAHFLISNMPNHTKNTHLRQNIVCYILPTEIFLVHCRQIITKVEMVKLLISILISHFSRTHSVSRSPSKLHWNLFERFFLDVHLAFTRAPASVHLTRKNAYAVVETEDRNRLAIAHPIRHSPLFFSRRLFLLLFGERGLLCRGVLFWG